MKLICLSDTHNRLPVDFVVPDGDILIHAGDLTMNGKQSELDTALRYLERLPHKRKIVISGNHDFCFQDDPHISREKCQHAGITYLQDSDIILEGIKFYGSPWQPWFYDWAFNFDKKDTGKQAFDTWARIPGDTDVLITHGPPYGILDRTNEGVFTGCRYLTDRMLGLKQLRYHIFGHIHEGYGSAHQLTPSGTEITHLNVSVCNRQYKPVNEPMEIEI